MKRRTNSGRSDLRGVLLTLFILVVAVTAHSAQSDVCGPPRRDEAYNVISFDLIGYEEYYLWYRAEERDTEITMMVHTSDENHRENIPSPITTKFTTSNTEDFWRIRFRYDTTYPNLVITGTMMERQWHSGRKAENVSVQSNKPMVWINCTQDNVLPVSNNECPTPQCSAQTPRETTTCPPPSPCPTTITTTATSTTATPTTATSTTTSDPPVTQGNTKPEEKSCPCYPVFTLAALALLLVVAVVAVMASSGGLLHYRKRALKAESKVIDPERKNSHASPSRIEPQPAPFQNPAYETQEALYDEWNPTYGAGSADTNKRSSVNSVYEPYVPVKE